MYSFQRAVSLRRNARYSSEVNGFGVMPDYAQQVQPKDRWAIVAYIRALQLSQHATLADVPPDQRQQLGTKP